VGCADPAGVDGEREIELRVSEERIDALDVVREYDRAKSSRCSRDTLSRFEVQDAT